MVKRILLASLFLFMPLFGYADSAVLGRDMDEKNIPLEGELMMGAFVEAFNKQIVISNNLPIAVIDKNRLQDKFVNYFYDHVSSPFSYRELVNACRYSVGRNRANECAIFANIYTKKLENLQVSMQKPNLLRNIAEQDINNINNMKGAIGERVVTRGYEPEQLPEDLRNRFADAMVGFMVRCYSTDTNEEEMMTVTSDSRTGADLKGDFYIISKQELPEDYVLPNLLEHEIAYCRKTYKKQ
jgi:hypothetical protein